MRAVLSDIALRLALECGVDKVRVEDIAAAADVSPRTFNNYFSSKEAAIVGNAYRRSEQIRDALASRPAGEPLEQALRAAVLTSFPETPDRQWAARIMLLRDDPALLGQQRKADLEIERALAAAIADRTRIDPARDIYPWLLASTLVATLRTAVLFWSDAPSGGPTLHQTLDQAIGRLRISPPDEGNVD
jgi:AcrR family transcriptional regulator